MQQLDVLCRINYFSTYAPRRWKVLVGYYNYREISSLLISGKQ